MQYIFKTLIRAGRSEPAKFQLPAGLKVKYHGKNIIRVGLVKGMQIQNLLLCHSFLFICLYWHSLDKKEKKTNFLAPKYIFANRDFSVKIWVNLESIDEKLKYQNYLQIHILFFFFFIINDFVFLLHRHPTGHLFTHSTILSATVHQTTRPTPLWTDHKKECQKP